MKGDSLTVPTINLDDVQVEVIFTVSIVLTFDIENKKWVKPHDEEFKIDIINFLGPFGLSKSVVSAVLGISVPILRDHLIKMLPVELGLIVSTLPVPLNINGSFSIDGDITWDAISKTLFMSEDICRKIDYSGYHVLNFIGIQKSIGRKSVLKSMQDFLLYKRKYEKCAQWNTIRTLWDDASLAYFSKTSQLSHLHPQLDLTQFFSFEKLLSCATIVLNSKVTCTFDLSHIEGQISLRNILDHVHQFVLRIIDSVQRKASEEVSDEEEILRDMSDILIENMTLLDITLKNLDYLQSKVFVNLISGSNAELIVALKDFTIQGPLAHYVSLPTNDIMGYNFLIPFLINIKTYKEGTIDIKTFHLSCIELLEKFNFQRLMKNKKLQNSTSTQNSSNTIPFTLPSHYDAWEMICLKIRRPLVSLIADNKVTFDRGAALFTMQVGPVDKTWKPQGSQESANTDLSYIADIYPMKYCPLLAQTSNHIKMLTKVPEIVLVVNLLNTIKFINSHIATNDHFLDFFMFKTGNDKADNLICVVNFLKIILSYFENYVKSPNIGLSINLSVRVIANNNDVIICLENFNHENCAMKVSAKANINDFFSDFKLIKNSFLNCIK